MHDRPLDSHDERHLPNQKDASATTTGTKTLPFGAWPSPVTTAMLTQSPPGIREPGNNGIVSMWVESRPQERGRHVLVMATPNGQRDLTPEPFSVRNRVHEYG